MSGPNDKHESTGVSNEPALEFVTVTALPICSACLDGEGGECHTPGCVFWINRAPDIPLRPNLEARGARISSTGTEFAGTCHDKAAAGMPELIEAWREYDRAQKASLRACDARSALPPGSTRARVTTANANWARKAEERDRRQEIFRERLRDLAGSIG